MVRPSPRFQAAVAGALARQEGNGPRVTGAHLPPPWDYLYTAATSRLVRKFLEHLAFAGVPAPVLEHVLIPGRKFRADLAWPEQRVFVECDGATFVAGRHGSGSGIKSDCEKFSLAAGLGWRLVRVEEMWLRTSKPVEWIKAALAYAPRINLRAVATSALHAEEKARRSCAACGSEYSSYAWFPLPPRDGDHVDAHRSHCDRCHKERAAS